MACAKCGGDCDEKRADSIMIGSWKTASDGTPAPAVGIILTQEHTGDQLYYSMDAEEARECIAGLQTAVDQLEGRKAN